MSSSNCLAVALVMLLIVACEPDKPKSSRPRPTGVPAIQGHTPQPATPGMQAKHNMDAGIKQLRQAIKAQPESVALRKALVSALLQRAKFVGKAHDYDEALAVADGAVDKAKDDKSAHLLRARLYEALNRFDDASAELDKAEELGAAKDDTARMRGRIATGLGNYDDALEILSAQRSQHEDTVSCALEGVVLGRMGKYEQADASFAKAAKLHRQQSPYDIAWVYFEQGTMWHRAGDQPRAQALYEQAIAKLPGYADAALQLASLLPPPQAAELLGPVVKVANDPAYPAALAALMDTQGKRRGEQMRKAATAGYAQLLKRHPQAFAERAAWFHLDALADTDRALELAEANLKQRATPQAYELLVFVQLGAGNKAKACAAATKGLALKYPSPGLRSAAVEAFEQCGRKDRATTLRAEIGERKPGRGLR